MWRSVLALLFNYSARHLIFFKKLSRFPERQAFGDLVSQLLPLLLYKLMYFSIHNEQYFHLQTDCPCVWMRIQSLTLGLHNYTSFNLYLHGSKMRYGLQATKQVERCWSNEHHHLYHDNMRKFDRDLWMSQLPTNACHHRTIHIQDSLFFARTI